MSSEVSSDTGDLYSTGCSALRIDSRREAWKRTRTRSLVDLVGDRMQTPSRGGKAKTVGVLEKKANTTYIGGEVKPLHSSS